MRARNDGFEGMSQKVGCRRIFQSAPAAFCEGCSERGGYDYVIGVFGEEGITR